MQVSLRRLIQDIPRLAAVAIGVGLLLAAAPAAQAEEVEVTINIKDHKFDPAEVKVPAGKALKITVNNLDDTPEEFESYEFQVEKIIGGKQSAVVRVKPLDKGKYNFFGEFHEATAQGTLIAE